MSFDIIIQHALPDWVVSEIQLISQDYEIPFDDALEIYYSNAIESENFDQDDDSII